MLQAEAKTNPEDLTEDIDSVDEGLTSDELFLLDDNNDNIQEPDEDDTFQLSGEADLSGGANMAGLGGNSSELTNLLPLDNTMEAIGDNTLGIPMDEAERSIAGHAETGSEAMGNANTDSLAILEDESSPDTNVTPLGQNTDSSEGFLEELDIKTGFEPKPETPTADGDVILPTMQTSALQQPDKATYPSQIRPGLNRIANHLLIGKFELGENWKEQMETKGIIELPEHRDKTIRFLTPDRRIAIGKIIKVGEKKYAIKVKSLTRIP